MRSIPNLRDVLSHVSLLALLLPAANAVSADDRAAVPVPAAASCALVRPCGDVNDSGSVTSSDALTILRLAVGQSVTVKCEVSGGGGGVGAAPLKTGQTTCWAEGGYELECGVTGQDGDTKLGIAFSYTDNGNGTVTDNNTGLVWEKLDDNNQAGDAGIHDKTRTYTFVAAPEKINVLNNASFGGRNDWRLPNVRELATLVDYGRTNPSIASVFNSDCTPGCTVTTCSCTGIATAFWSSTTYDWTKNNSWSVWFYEGTTSSYAKNTLLHVRAVAGGQ